MHRKTHALVLSAAIIASSLAAGCGISITRNRLTPKMSPIQTSHAIAGEYANRNCSCVNGYTLWPMLTDETDNVARSETATVTLALKEDDVLHATMNENERVVRSASIPFKFKSKHHRMDLSTRRNASGPIPVVMWGINKRRVFLWKHPEGNLAVRIEYAGAGFVLIVPLIIDGGAMGFAYPSV